MSTNMKIDCKTLGQTNIADDLMRSGKDKGTVEVLFGNNVSVEVPTFTTIRLTSFKTAIILPRKIIISIFYHIFFALTTIL